jgi:hypothetical protein
VSGALRGESRTFEILLILSNRNPKNELRQAVSEPKFIEISANMTKWNNLEIKAHQAKEFMPGLYSG